MSEPYQRDESIAVADYLSAFPHHHEFSETWSLQGELRVRLSLSNTLPPAEVSSSMLAIVFDAQQRVVVLAPGKMSGNIAHLLIGGRPEPGETPETAIQREVSEETGWAVNPVRMVGFRHFHHLGPNVEGNDRQYPDFIQPIFAARTIEHRQDMVRPDDYLPWALLDYEQVEQIMEPGSRVLLRAAAKAVVES